MENIVQKFIKKQRQNKFGLKSTDALYIVESQELSKPNPEHIFQMSSEKPLSENKSRYFYYEPVYDKENGQLLTYEKIHATRNDLKFNEVTGEIDINGIKDLPYQKEIQIETPGNTVESTIAGYTKEIKVDTESGEFYINDIKQKEVWNPLHIENQLNQFQKMVRIFKTKFL